MFQVRDHAIDACSRTHLRRTLVPTCKQAGVIGAMGGVIGSLQAMEAIKYILGVGELLTGYLLTYDALKMEFRKVKAPSGYKGLCSMWRAPYYHRAYRL